jgi:hypothetical protein
VPEAGSLDFLYHSERLGRLSALSMLFYFAIGPYVNLTMLSVPVPLFTALIFPSIGIVLMLLIIALPRYFPRYFPWFSSVFAAYSLLILYLTA